MIYSSTKVLIIGNGKFEDNQISEIPNITANNQELSKLFSNDLYFPGIEETRILSLENKNYRELSRSITTFTENCDEKDTIIIYLSGHGIVSSNDFKLYFPAKDTLSKFIEDEGISIDSLKSRLRSSSASSKILVLDCCFSGRAIDGTMSSNLVSQTITTNVLESVSGTYIMTSACQDKPALFDSNNDKVPTNFTNQFIETIKDGINNKKENLEIGDIFNTIKSKTKKGPTPQASSLNEADKIPLGRNLHDPLRKELINRIQHLEGELTATKNKSSNTSKTEYEALLKENKNLKAQNTKAKKEIEKINEIRISQKKAIDKLKSNRISDNSTSQKDRSLKFSFAVNFGLILFTLLLFKFLVLGFAKAYWWGGKVDLRSIAKYDTTSSDFFLLWTIYAILLALCLSLINRGKMPYTK